MIISEPLAALLFALLACGVLLWIAIDDTRRRIIKNHNIIALLILFLLFISVAPMQLAWEWHVLAAVLTFIFTLFCFHQGWFGGGDAKLLPIVVLWLGYKNLLWFFVLTTVGGLVLSVLASVIMARMHKGKTAGEDKSWRQQKLPYGVAIAFGGITLLITTYIQPLLAGVG